MGGDRFYAEADYQEDYRGTPGDWPEFLRIYLREYAIQAVFLLGDCRYYHRTAKPVCDQLGVAFMVFEEGYLRPNTITLEQHGVNALSQLDLSPETIRKTEVGSVKAPVTMGGSMWSRTRRAAAYYWASCLSRRFPHYQHHRASNPIKEGFCWWRGWFRKLRVRSADRALEHLLTGKFSQRFVLVPLQVHDDSQMIYHSDYDSIEAFIAQVMASFADYAAEDQVLCFKHHPMDRGYTHYGAMILRLAEELGLHDRVFYCHDVPLPALYRHARSVLTVNSTVGLSALLHHLPTKTMGRAMYDIPGLTHQGDLASFWQSPEAVDAQLFRQLQSYLFQKTQVNGSFFKHWALSCQNALAFYEELMDVSRASGAPQAEPDRDNPDVVNAFPPLEAH